MNQSTNPSKPIFIVEDYDPDFEITQIALTESGILAPIRRFLNGEELLTALRSNTRDKEDPSLILLDLNLPGLDGRDVLKILKSDDDLKSIPVIVLSTSNHPSDVDVCYRGGANTYFQKPPKFESLVSIMKNIKQYWFDEAELPRGLNP
jgi:CheY-like chemotaxis protein